MGKVRLASIVPYKIFPPVMGGQRAIALYNKYVSQHVDFICITTQANKADEYTIVNVFSDSALRYINPLNFFRIRKLIKKEGITHLQIEHPYFGWLGVLLKWFAGVQLVVRSHNIEGLRWKTLGKWWWGILWHYERWVHRRADHNFFMQDEDRLYALKHFGLQPGKCITITYGIEWQTPPSATEKAAARNYLQQTHNIPAHHHILLYNGAFKYPPNLHGLERILKEINPQMPADFPYTFLICGKDIPFTGDYPNVVFAGFVEDVTVYFKGADVFVNAITEGGGIKTKLVEALGYNLNAVSASHGAIGIDPELCNGKLVVTDDNFVAGIIQLATYNADIPQSFFDHFYWDNIAKKAVEALHL